jgi:hypothetical protein
MDTKALRRLIKQYLVPSFPELTLSRNQADLFFVPMNHIYRYVGFSGSSYSRSTIRVTSAFMPLYLPIHFFHVSFGRRLKHEDNNDAWEWSEADETRVFDSITQSMRTQGLPLLNTIRSPMDFARSKYVVNDTSPLARRGEIYSLICDGAFGEALPKMEELITTIEIQFKQDPYKTTSDVEWHQRDKELHGLLKEDPEMARSRLLEWEQLTIKKLKLDKYPN